MNAETINEALDAIRSAFSKAVDWVDADIDCPHNEETGETAHEPDCSCNALVNASQVEDAINEFYAAMEAARAEVAR